MNFNEMTKSARREEKSEQKSKQICATVTLKLNFLIVIPRLKYFSNSIIIRKRVRDFLREYIV